MPTALRDLQPWRQALIEAGLPLTWAAAVTGKSYNTVVAYSIGRRRAPQVWVEQVTRLAAESLEKGVA